MERLLVEAAAKDAAVSIDRYVGFASSGVTMANIGDLLNHAVHLKSGTAIHTRLMRVLPFLTYVDSDKMSLVIRHFEDVLDFEKFDAEHGADDHAKVEAFVAMCEGIERNQVSGVVAQVSDDQLIHRSSRAEIRCTTQPENI